MDRSKLEASLRSLAWKCVTSSSKSTTTRRQDWPARRQRPLSSREKISSSWLSNGKTRQSSKSYQVMQNDEPFEMSTKSPHDNSFSKKRFHNLLQQQKIARKRMWHFHFHSLSFDIVNKKNNKPKGMCWLKYPSFDMTQCLQGKVTNAIQMHTYLLAMLHISFYSEVHLHFHSLEKSKSTLVQPTVLFLFQNNASI